MDYSYIDLFCGAGGLSAGFNRAGFQNVFSVEFNPEFAKTYRRNFPSHKLLVEDICDISNERIKELIGDKEVDVIIGGPPCQGFSYITRLRTKFFGNI